MLWILYADFMDRPFSRLPRRPDVPFITTEAWRLIRFTRASRPVGTEVTGRHHTSFPFFPVLTPFWDIGLLDSPAQ